MIDDKALEQVTCDMVNMLRGKERADLLKAYHDWKKRQLNTDKRIETNKATRIRTFLRCKDPEYKKHLQEIKNNWSKNNRKKLRKIERKRRILKREEIRKYNRERYKKHRDEIHQNYLIHKLERIKYSH